MPLWTLLLPAAAAALLGVAIAAPMGTLLAAACAAALTGAVIASVHHAEVIAHTVGEPFGTLVLALAVTVIECALILSMMLSGGPEQRALPRDTIFAAIMIICNGVVGVCLLLGGLRHREQVFRIEGANSALAGLVTLAALTLVLPKFTTSSPGPTYTAAQLGFAAIASLTVWAVFVFVQTVRHRDYFLPPAGSRDESAHAPPPSAAHAWASFGLLLVSLVAVVGLAKMLSPAIEAAVARAGAPKAVIGIAIAMIVLLPETLSAVRAARRGLLQTSMNLALGSALATIGLTIPAVVVTSIVLDLPLVLGLPAKEMVLLALALLLTSTTVASGRATVLQGVVHLVVFAVFLFLAMVP